ncbi:MAG: GNAT family protein [Kiloniellales bacterium]
MPPTTNHLGQPVGFAVPDWVPARLPPRTTMEGRWCRVAPLDVARHGAELFAAFAEDREGRNWTYMGDGPFAERAGFEAWMAASCLGDDPLFHAVVEGASGRALGVASYLRMEPETGTIEVGNINYAPPLQRTAAAAAAMFLMMARVFEELGYRRYEWKCDALNAASRRAAERLGFVFEGVFRQATMYKGRNRDTAGTP